MTKEDEGTIKGYGNANRTGKRNHSNCDRYGNFSCDTQKGMKKGGKKKEKGSDASHKLETVVELRKPDETLMSTSTIDSNYDKSMICEMEAEKQAPPKYSVPAIAKPITVKTQKVPTIVINHERYGEVSFIKGKFR